MKKLFLIIFLCAGIAAHAQNILRVNSIPIVDAPYRTINAALAAAVNDDIIMVEGAPTTYNESITITKRLKIVGTGYFLAGTTFQANPYPSIMGDVVFNSGSEGSVVTGFKLGNAYLNVSNVTFSYNNCNSVNISASSVSVIGNYLFTVGRNYYEGTTITNVLVANNYMGNGISFNSDWTYSVVANNIIDQNCVVLNGQVNNNIFLRAVDPLENETTTKSTFLNNIFVAPSQTGVSTANGNVFNVSQASLFVGLPGNNTDTQWKLKAGSPAIGAGASGVDCGIYGGATPYRPSGIVAGQPTITSFTLPGTVPQNGTLNVKVSAKVN